MDAQFPTRTAGEITLPNGDTVWVKTLNALQREEADSESNWAAQAKCRAYRQGGERADDLAAEFAMLSPADQAEFLASHEIVTGRLGEESLQKHPAPVRPERGDKDEAAWMDACAAWEKAAAKADAERAKFEAKRLAEERKAALALSDAERLARCTSAWLTQRYMREYATASTLETLRHAVRVATDRGRAYFADGAAVRDADDADREALVAFYRELDSVKPAEVPTSAGA